MTRICVNLKVYRCIVGDSAILQSPIALPFCKRPARNCSRWSGAQPLSTCDATLPSRRTWSNLKARQCASPAPWNRTAPGRGSLKRNQVIFGVSRADLRCPSPFCLSARDRSQLLQVAGHSAPQPSLVRLRHCAHAFSTAPCTLPTSCARQGK